MKTFRKLLSLALVLAMVLSLGVVVAFADDSSNTITINNSVKGTVYTLYKMLDVTVDNQQDPTLYSYTVNTPWSTFFADSNSATWSTVFRKTASGYIEALDSVNNDSAALKTFARAAAAYAKTNNIAADKDATATGDSVAIDTTNGYYLITSSLGSNAILDTTPGDVEINEKNEVPTIEKKIVEGTNEVDANDVNVGDNVDYKVTVAVKAGTDHYVVTDTFSKGLTYQNDLNIVATTGDNPAANTDYTAVTTKNAAGETILTITFTDDYINKLTNKNGEGVATNDTLTFTYSAKVNENAVIKDVANPNTVRLDYKHNDKEEHQDDSVKTYTYGFDIKKINGANEALAGAKFNLKSDVTALTFTEVTLDGHKAYRYDEAGSVTELETPSSGYIYIFGLDAGEYTLTETQAPNNYNKLTEDITVTISATITDGELASYDVTASSDATGVVSAGTHTGHYYNDNTSGDLVKEIDILNNKGTELPSTGGIGTTIFYIVGGILVAAAAVLLITRRRLAAK